MDDYSHLTVEELRENITALYIWEYEATQTRQTLENELKRREPHNL